MKYLLILSFGACALAVPVLSVDGGDSAFTARELSSIQPRSFNHDRETTTPHRLLPIQRRASSLRSPRTHSQTQDRTGIYPERTADVCVGSSLGKSSCTTHRQQQNTLPNSQEPHERFNRLTGTAATHERGSTTFHGHDHSPQSQTSSRSQNPSLLPRSLDDSYFSGHNPLQKRTRRSSSEQQLSRTRSRVNFPSPEKNPSDPTQPPPPPKRVTNLRQFRGFKSQSSLVGLSSSSPPRASSPWRRGRDPLASTSPRNSLDRTRRGQSPPPRIPRTQSSSSSRGGSPWGDGGGAVHGDNHPSDHSILGFNPLDPHPPLRIPSRGSLSEKAEIASSSSSPLSPFTPTGRAPVVADANTPVTPVTPITPATPSNPLGR